MSGRVRDLDICVFVTSCILGFVRLSSCLVRVCSVCLVFVFRFFGDLSGQKPWNPLPLKGSSCISQCAKLYPLRALFGAQLFLSRAMALSVCHRSFGYRVSLLALRAACSYSDFGYRVGRGENRAQWKQQFSLRGFANTAEEIGCATTVSGWVCFCSQGVFPKCVPSLCVGLLSGPRGRDYPSSHAQGVFPRCVLRPPWA